MKTIRTAALLAACLMAGASWAQQAGKPLNLKLPPAGSYPASSSSAASGNAANGDGTAGGNAASAAGTPGNAGANAAASASARSGTAGAPANANTQPGAANGSTYGKDPPGTYYGDTSGRMGRADETARAVPACDDATYNQPQMHGSVGMGVVGGSHASGNYQSAAVNISQAFGSCEHPTGGMSISIGGETGHFHGR